MTAEPNDSVKVVLTSADGITVWLELSESLLVDAGDLGRLLADGLAARRERA